MISSEYVVLPALVLAVLAVGVVGQRLLLQRVNVGHSDPDVQGSRNSGPSWRGVVATLSLFAASGFFGALVPLAYRANTAEPKLRTLASELSTAKAEARSLEAALSDRESQIESLASQLKEVQRPKLDVPSPLPNSILPEPDQQLVDAKAKVLELEKRNGELEVQLASAARELAGRNRLLEELAVESVEEALKKVQSLRGEVVALKSAQKQLIVEIHGEYASERKKARLILIQVAHTDVEDGVFSASLFPGDWKVYEIRSEDTLTYLGAIEVSKSSGAIDLPTESVAKIDSRERTLLFTTKLYGDTPDAHVFSIPKKLPK